MKEHSSRFFLLTGGFLLSREFVPGVFPAFSFFPETLSVHTIRKQISSSFLFRAQRTGIRAPFECVCLFPLGLG